MISEQAVFSYFAQLRNWGLAASGSFESGWHAIYQGRLRNYDVYLEINEEWVYFQCPLLYETTHPKCKPALHEYLLRANDRMFLAKFALFRVSTSTASVDWVGLTTECSVDSFNAGTFRLMAEAIATYAEQYDREIQAIALDPDVAALAQDAEWDEPADGYD